jgi:uncharacterized membrane protein
MLTHSPSQLSEELKPAVSRKPTVEITILVVLVAIGVYCRFANLDAKAYWYDEAFTSLELSGLSSSHAESDILTGRVVSVSDVNRYQSVDQSSGKTAFDTARAIAKTEPQLTPLYFIATRLWAERFGSSVRVIRLFSAVLSVAILPLAGWLCMELFDSWRVCWFCVALISVSPFQVLYAQEARPYGMWAGLSLLLSALLVRVLRRESALGWILYGLVAVISLYTYLFTLLVIAGHGIYVVIFSRFGTKTIARFMITAALAVALLLPWPYRGQVSGSGNEAYSLGRYATKWLRNVSVFFVDFDFNDSTAKLYLIPFGAAVILLTLLVGYAVYYVAKTAPLKASSFVLSFIFVLALSLCLLDVFAGSSRATITRYLYPSFLGVEIAVAYLLAVKTHSTPNSLLGSGWKLVSAILLGAGLASCGMIATSDRWWTKAPENYVLAASRIINQDKAPLVVSDAWFVNILSLEHNLRSDSRFQLTVSPNTPEIGKEDKVFFVYHPSNHLVSEFERQFDMQLVERASGLWRARRR